MRGTGGFFISCGVGIGNGEGDSLVIRLCFDIDLAMRCSVLDDVRHCLAQHSLESCVVKLHRYRSGQVSDGSNSKTMVTQPFS